VLISGLDISRDGKLLASADTTNTIRLWSLPYGTPQLTLEGADSSVRAVAFGAADTLLASAAGESLRLWHLPDGAPLNCLFDPEVLSSSREVHSYTLTDEDDREIIYTVPCGTPIPENATCTCDCIMGSYTPPSSGGSGSGSGSPSGGGGQTCTCNTICTCVPVPVCQAHKLADEDAAIRAMAGQLVLCMGPRAREYLAWAQTGAPHAVSERIVQLSRAVASGVQAEPNAWPSLERCLELLEHRDPIVRIMAAQSLVELAGHASWDPSLEARCRIEAALELACELNWKLRAHPMGESRRAGGVHAHSCGSDLPDVSGGARDVGSWGPSSWSVDSTRR
jgi:hypothetical protein